MPHPHFEEFPFDRIPSGRVFCFFASDAASDSSWGPAQQLAQLLLGERRAAFLHFKQMAPLQSFGFKTPKHNCPVSNLIVLIAALFKGYPCNMEVRRLPQEENRQPVQFHACWRVAIALFKHSIRFQK